MFDFGPGWEWLAVSYVVGSITTFLLVYKSITVNAIEKTIDMLCESGYIKHRRTANGEVEILKYNHVDENK